MSNSALTHREVPYYKRTIRYYIKSICAQNGFSNIDSLDENIVGYFINKYVTDKDRLLINLVFNENVSQNDLDSFFNSYDIEEEGGYKALLLAYFMRAHSDLKFPENVEPRLRGLLEYFRFRNLKFISHFKKVCNKLTKSDIKIMLLKGAVMKHYFPEFPRVMGDIDILVPLEQYQQAKELALEFGYNYTEYPHSVDLLEPETNTNVLDIHHKVPMKTQKEYCANEDFFNRAQIQKVFGVENIYVPSDEDIIFIGLTNLLRNLMTNETAFGYLYFIWDYNCLLKKNNNINWDIVKQNAIKTGTEDVIYIAIKFLNEFLPQKLPVLFKQQFIEKSTLWLYNEYFIKKLRKENHSINIKTKIKRFWNDIKKYAGFAPQYVFFRRKFIGQNPKIAKMILKNQKLIK